MESHLAFWVAGGATLAYFDGGAAATTSDVLPMGEIGFARGGEDVLLSADFAVRLTTAIDRFDGEVSSSAEAACSLAWRLAPRLSIGASTLASARRDGETALGRTSVRARWMVREFVALEAGVTGALQRERRPEVPSFVEGAVLTNVAWTLRERLTFDVGFIGRVHEERRPDGRSFVESAVFAGFGYGRRALFGAARVAVERQGRDADAAAGTGATPPAG